MKLTVDRDPLLKAVGRASSVVARTGTIPIIANLLLSADAQGRLALTATDLDIQIAVEAEARVEAPGACTVPAVRLNDLLRNLPAGGEVALAYDAAKSRLKVACARTRVELPTLPADDFPTFTAEGLTDGGEIAPAVLARLLKKARFCVSSEEPRYYLQGVYLTAVPANGGGPARLRAVATDGHRLAVAEIHAPPGFEAWPGVIVPTKAVDEALNLLGGETGAVLRGGAAKFSLAVGQDRMVSKLIDGTFPDYERVIPRDNPHTVTLDAVQLVHALKRAMVMADDKSRSLRLAVETDGVVRLVARSSEGGQIEEELEAADYDGPALSVGFNARYLQDVLAHIDGEMIALHLAAEAASPVLATDPADKAVRYVIMPLRV